MTVGLVNAAGLVRSSLLDVVAAATVTATPDVGRDIEAEETSERERERLEKAGLRLTTRGRMLGFGSTSAMKTRIEVCRNRSGRKGRHAHARAAV